MFAWQATVQDEHGNAVPLPVVTVYLEDGATLASIFNEDGLPVSNPFTGDIGGFVQFFAEAGTYKVTGASSSGATNVWNVFLDTPLQDAVGRAEAAAASAESDASSAALAALAAESYAQTAASGANYYDTVALGRAAVADGETFGVVAGGADGFTRPTIFRRDSSTTQTFVSQVVSEPDLDETAYKASLWDFYGDTASDSFPLVLGEDGTIIVAGGGDDGGDGGELIYKASLWSFYGTTGLTSPALVLDESGRVLVWASQSGGGVSPTYRLRPAVGQSNAEGQAGASVSVVYPESQINLLTLTRGVNADVWLGLTTGGGSSTELIGDDLTGIGPLIPQIASTGNHGTISAEAAARASLSVGGDPIIVWSGAEGGQAIANLLPGAPAGYYGWQNMVTAMSRAAALAPIETRLRMDWVFMAQGESDTSNAALGSLHNTLRQDLQAQAETLFGQTEATRMISWQMSSFQSSSVGVRSILQWALDHADDGLFFCGGPTYGFPWSSDFLHFTSQGHAMRGEADAAIIRRVESEGAYLPLHVVSASVTGANEITAILSEAAVIDTTDAVVAPITNYGVTLQGGSVSSVAVSGAALIITTAGAAASVTEIRLGLSGQTSPRTVAAIPRTNIRAVRHLGQYSWGGVIKSWHAHQLVTL